MERIFTSFSRLSGIFSLGLVLSVMLIAAVSAAEKAKKPKLDDDPFKPQKENYHPPDRLLGFVDSRDIKSLNGTWRLIIDPMGIGDPGGFFGGFTDNRQQQSEMDLIEYNYETAQTINVPGDVNTQDERLFFYQGRVWYYRPFSVSRKPSERIHLWFGGANFATTVFINGQAVGKFEGGYVPFSFDISDYVSAGENRLVIRVDNRLGEDTVPTLKTDWWPYGGLTRDVLLVKTPQAYIRNAKVELRGLDENRIIAKIETVGMSAGADVQLSIPELGLTKSMTVDTEGVAKADFTVHESAERLELWSPDNPKLYDVFITSQEDKIQDRVGFRIIETQAQKILLNGQPIKLRGISTHEEPVGAPGVAYAERHVRGLLREAKALGVNFIRAAHYPYSRHLAKLADEMGIMVWEEIPVYWNIDWDNAKTLGLARRQIKRLIERDWNRASVIIWSIANETPYSEPRMRFLQTLVDDARSLDRSRLLTAALMGNPGDELAEIVLHIAARGIRRDDVAPKDKAIFKAILDKAGENVPAPDEKLKLKITDPLGELVDVISYNEYFGWYYALIFSSQIGIGEDVLRPIILDLMDDIILTANFDKPVHVSEFGAGAKAGRTGTGIWSEAYQAEVYRAQLNMLRQSPQVQGMTPWVLKDFRAMLRTLPGIQDYWNRKGLIDNNGRRKKAFYVLRDFYRVW